MDASVIIPSYNSRTTIARCLDALRAQETKSRYETIVVDSSDDGTGELIASSYPEVNLIRCAHRTLPGTARNMGIKAAQGQLLAFTDADCVPEAPWLDKLILRHAEENCSVIGGAVLNALPLNPVAWSGYLLEFNERMPSFPKRYVDLLPTCNVSFQKEVFERVGLFPTDLWPSEDHIFSWRLVQAGERLLFDPTIQVQHIFRPRLKSFLQHQLRLGKASAAARRQIDLPHAWVAEHPLRWTIPLVRLIFIEARLARWDMMNFLRFNLLSPLCLGGLIAWGIGFCASATPLDKPGNVG